MEILSARMLGMHAFAFLQPFGVHAELILILLAPFIFCGFYEAHIDFALLRCTEASVVPVGLGTGYS